MTYDLFASAEPPAGLVLDLGCGPGLDGPGLLERGFDLVGLDIIPAFLRHAAVEPAFAGRVVCGDLKALPCRCGIFAGVWADGSLHHVAKADLGHALKEIHGVLAPGGVLFASVERGAGETLVAPSRGLEHERFYAYYEPEEMRDAVSAAGFTLIEMIVSGRTDQSEGFLAFTARKRRVTPEGRDEGEPRPHQPPPNP